MRNQMKFGALSLSVVMLMAGAVCAEAAPATNGPSDAEIAHIVVTANTIDIDAGKLAESKSKNSEVKKFAKLMVTDHTAVNQQAVDLANKLGVTPQANATSTSLKKGGDENLATLKKLKGADFDRQYVDHEVAYHQAVIDAIDQTLIPSATNAELKALMVKVRPAFESHLEHAKMLQQKLNNSKASHS